MSETESTTPTDRDVNADDLFEASSHARRRAVLSYLHDADADHIAGDLS